MTNPPTLDEKAHEMTNLHKMTKLQRKNQVSEKNESITTPAETAGTSYT